MVVAMSAIVSLLRVMTLRDAEAITLEAGKVPSLRRRGLVEPMAMPALDAQMLAGFAQPLVAGKSLDDGPLMVAFVDPDGLSYPVTVERLASGLRLVIRRPAPAKAPKAPPPASAPPPVKQPVIKKAVVGAAPVVEAGPVVEGARRRGLELLA